MILRDRFAKNRIRGKVQRQSNEGVRGPVLLFLQDALWESVPLGGNDCAVLISLYQTSSGNITRVKSRSVERFRCLSLNHGTRKRLSGKSTKMIDFAAPARDILDAGRACSESGP